MSAKKKSSGGKKGKQGNLMYLGPTIIGVIRHSTIYKNGVLPEKVRDCVEAFPIMKKLFVTMEELPTAIKELKKEQSCLGTIYSQTARKFK